MSKSKNNLYNMMITFIIFFLLTIGNGKYLIDRFGNKIEYIGLVVLLLSTFCKAKKNMNTLKKDLKILIFSFILSFGAFYNNIPDEAKIMIFLSSALLMSYPKFSEIFLSENSQIKVVADSIAFGMIINSLLGIATGTLGFDYNANETFFKITFLSGLKVKNYCGGIWLIVFILYYVYYYRNETLKNHRIKFIILGLLILLSASKGACFLAIVFVLIINTKKILVLKERRGKFFYTILIILIIFIGIVTYNYIFINIPTYAYRIRGMNKLFSLLNQDFSKFMFGISNVAYANTGYDYTANMRNFLGWDASVEMAYVNILIKNGFLGYIVYFMIFKEILNKSKSISKSEKNLVISILIVMLLSGFTETYIASIHYVVGPTFFCLINGLVNKNSIKDDNSPNKV